MLVAQLHMPLAKGQCQSLSECARDSAACASDSVPQMNKQTDQQRWVDHHLSCKQANKQINYQTERESEKEEHTIICQEDRQINKQTGHCFPPDEQENKRIKKQRHIKEMWTNKQTNKQTSPDIYKKSNTQMHRAPCSWIFPFRVRLTFVFPLLWPTSTSSFVLSASIIPLISFCPCPAAFFPLLSIFFCFSFPSSYSSYSLFPLPLFLLSSSPPYRLWGELHPKGGKGAGEGDGPEHRQVKVHCLPSRQQRELHQSAQTGGLKPHLWQQLVPVLINFRNSHLRAMMRWKQFLLTVWRTLLRSTKEKFVLHS